MPNANGFKYRTLFLFSASESRVRMLAKGNVWYLRHYECSFDRVYFIYLQGGGGKPVRNGKVVLIGLGGNYKLLDLLLSPFRLFTMAKRIPTPYRLTADVLYSWWSTAIAKILMFFPFVLMPVCMPRELWKLRWPLPTILEHVTRRLMARLSFCSASYVLTSEAFGQFVRWLESYPLARNKLIITRALVDALPSPEFFQALVDMRLGGIGIKDNVRLKEGFQIIYVGRLEQEKHARDLIQIIKILSKDQDVGHVFTLHIVGDGSLKNEMQHEAESAGLSERVIFHGVVANRNLPALLSNKHVFLSTLTGTSLREAALCGLPVVAYDFDWISGLLVNEVTALMVKRADIDGMASAVKRLYTDEVLRDKLAFNVQALAVSLWSPAQLRESLAVAFPK